MTPSPESPARSGSQRGPDISAALDALRTPFRSSNAATFLSDLTVGELILLEQIGFRPVGIVSGAGSASWYPQFTTAGTEGQMWGRAIASAIGEARQDIYSEVGHLGASGVVAMRIEFEREPANQLTCTMLGTAVRDESGAHGKGRERASHFTTTLSARDFHLLLRAGYRAAGIVMGVSVVGFSARSASQSLGLARENIELEGQTNALYSAREQAMGMMEREAASLRADGVVAVELSERPINTLLTHAVELMAIGTAVHRATGGHGSLGPSLQLALDDPVADIFARG